MIPIVIGAWVWDLIDAYKGAEAHRATANALGTEPGRHEFGHPLRRVRGVRCGLHGEDPLIARQDHQ